MEIYSVYSTVLIQGELNVDLLCKILFTSWNIREESVKKFLTIVKFPKYRIVCVIAWKEIVPPKEIDK